MHRLVSLLQDAASLIQSDKIVAENQDYFLQESTEQILLDPIKKDLSKNVSKKTPATLQLKEKVPPEVLQIIKVMGYENFKTIQLPQSKFWDESTGKAVREIPEPTRLLKCKNLQNFSPNVSSTNGSPQQQRQGLFQPFTGTPGSDLVGASPQEILWKFTTLQSQGDDLYRKTSQLA